MSDQQGSAAPDGPPGRARPVPKPTGTARLALAVGALGVVFGDIGTSPIYTLQTVFDPTDPHPVPLTTGDVYGVVSLVFWSVTVIVTVTYVLLAMRADNDGEGGIMALITLVRRWGAGPGRRAAMLLAGLGIFGASLFVGDSMITPAISVLSAVEGLKVVEPSLGELVVPVTAVIILVLFLVQRRGTGAVGRVFGPVMIAWFVAIGTLGLVGITRRPEILRALSPTYAVGFLVGHFGVAFFSLAAVVLAVTGAEALYADMGHFGRPAITRSWLFLVFPACLASYMGQGALILADPHNVHSPFFLLAPGWGRLPLVLLATAATVIAAQAVITGAYSVAAQAARLGYLPRLRVAHTSAQRFGQIYVPWVNWLLLVSVLTLVFAFRSSAALAFAYGVAVTGTITITTLLFFYIARKRWRTPVWLIAAGASVLLVVDLLFLAANLTKLTHGAWLPLLIAVSAFTVMVTWQRGRAVVTAERQRREGSLRTFVEQVRRHRLPTVRVPGTAVFLNRGARATPLAMRANVEYNHVLHEHVVILSLTTEPTPRVPAAERIAVADLGYDDDGIIQVTARFGYMEAPDVPAVLATLDPARTEGWLELDRATYFLSKMEIRRGPAPTMAPWRKRLFIATSHLTADAAEHFKLPRERTVILGSQVEL
ncbi:potassium transporter Kup [Actinocatenispora rupis]|uniref:Probable potassium transport system protein Kup n=1 Tax=Actinocatenispora rupis TaxID=519421 RepID=A0A8J3J7P6_9ACTN|nr:KUP/HAK/KT family potassium transporter [Actinocatenispora rupis]GID09903.1 putative potassium transport system protein kup [Actinocatenispora rupis]